jgi:hypothetical protein
MNDDDRLTDEAIEAALRGLPTIDVPRELEARLHAGIPRTKVIAKTGRKPMRWREWLAVSAAVLLVMASIAAWRAGEKMTTVSGTTSPNPNQDMVAVSFVQTKETDPCNILPTLHDWQ